MPTLKEVLDRASGKLPIEALRLGQQTDEEITAIADQFSFDLDTFDRRISIKSRSQKVLVAHLYLDHIVSAILNESLAAPTALDLERIGFAQKIQLAEGLGVLRREEKAMLKSINDVRNRLAHKLDFEVDDEQISRIQASTPKSINEWMSKKSGRRKVSLSNILSTIVIFMEFRRQAEKRSKLLARRNEIHWAATMIEVDRVLSRRGNATP